MNWWRALSTGGRLLVVVAGIAILAGAAVVFMLITDTGGTIEFPGQLSETTPSAETVTPASDEVDDPGTPEAKAPTPTEPSSPERVFGALRGIRDESGGTWQTVWIDVDTADFLTGDAALAFLTSQGDQDFYDADYWYIRDEGAAITSFKIPPSGQGTVKVIMYTYPNVPSIGFYGPAMDEQVVAFGQFYDAIYMDEDSSGLLGRYYWFTVEEGIIVAIEEQPRDPYYEP
ncbi:MAG: hypothetical protein JXE06_05840 [Coriobacteriia bacterium]|nr:hypothetical protein [Coriobacteriia bacterium]MBN2823029.1 hypothetical protein [Coriobacteriia bacterium]